MAGIFVAVGRFKFLSSRVSTLSNIALALLGDYC